MRATLLFLSLVGVAIYGFFVVTGNALSEGNSKHYGAVKALPNHSERQFLSSWGSYLPSRSRSQNPRIATHQKPTSTSGQEQRDAHENAAPYEAATSSNSAVGSDNEGKSSPEMGSSTPNQVAEETTTKTAAVTAPPERKIVKRSRSKPKIIKQNPSAKRPDVVVDAVPWGGRGASRADRRRGFGLFFFRPGPRMMALGR
jgi:hypothetical protein